MTFRIIVSPPAMRDVDRLETWLLDKNPAVAERVGETLKAAIGSLAELPYRGRPIGRGTRALNAPFGGSVYVVRYQVRGEIVVITRIFHGRENR